MPTENWRKLFYYIFRIQIFLKYFKSDSVEAELEIGILAHIIYLKKALGKRGEGGKADRAAKN